jgi:rhodanese-related sulfurtransferase
MPREIDRDELMTKLANSEVRLLDVQGPGWFEREHLPGAIRGRIDDPDGTWPNSVTTSTPKSSSTATTPPARAPSSPRNCSKDSDTAMSGATPPASRTGSTQDFRSSLDSEPQAKESG